MRSTPAFNLSALVVGLTLCGCGDGQPWGELFTSLHATFAPAAERIDAEGRLKTSKSFAVAIERVSVVVDQVGISMAGSVGSTQFDPANPPAGYSLCHNGHCHSADGRLVDYEEIEADIATGSGQGGFELTLPVVQGSEVTLSRAPAALLLMGCEGGCPLPRGVLARASVLVTSLSIQGRAFDGSTQERLPAEGRPLDFSLPLQVSLEASLMRAVDRGEPVVVALDLRFDLPSTVLDGVDLGGDLDGSLTSTINKNLGESEGLTAQITQTQPQETP